MRSTAFAVARGTDLAALRSFRVALYDRLERRTDALFELCDAVLTSGSVPSPVHLSLAPVHRRGWGSLYAALDKGRIDAEALRDMLAGRHSGGGSTKKRPAVYAVDTSAWPRCDAETSPERGYYYHPSRHSAGQPIVAGIVGIVAVVGLWMLKKCSVWLTVVVSVLNLLSAAPGIVLAPNAAVQVFAAVGVVIPALIFVLVVLPTSRRAFAAT